jgi:hypothetical protein
MLSIARILQPKRRYFVDVRTFLPVWGERDAEYALIIAPPLPPAKPMTKPEGVQHGR